VAQKNGISSRVIVVEAGAPSWELRHWVKFQNGLRALGRLIDSETPNLVRKVGPEIPFSCAVLVVCGQLDESTQELIRELGQLRCYRALIGHRSPKRDPGSFLRIATGWSYCQVNSSQLDRVGAVVDLPQRLVEFSVRDGRDTGLLWGDSRWFRIEGPAIQAADEATAGDLFGTAYIVARHFGNAAAKDALRYAERVVGEWHRRRDVPAYAC
jgi:hypothetical protein